MFTVIFTILTKKYAFENSRSFGRFSTLCDNTPNARVKIVQANDVDSKNIAYEFDGDERAFYEKRYQALRYGDPGKTWITSNRLYNRTIWLSDIFGHSTIGETPMHSTNSIEGSEENSSIMSDFKLSVYDTDGNMYLVGMIYGKEWKIDETSVFQLYAGTNFTLRSSGHVIFTARLMSQQDL